MTKVGKYLTGLNIQSIIDWHTENIEKEFQEMLVAIEKDKEQSLASGEISSEEYYEIPIEFHELYYAHYGEFDNAVTEQEVLDEFEEMVSSGITDEQKFGAEVLYLDALKENSENYPITAQYFAEYPIPLTNEHNIVVLCHQYQES